jgi:hypothetical protein
MMKLIGKIGDKEGSSGSQQCRFGHKKNHRLRWQGVVQHLGVINVISSYAKYFHDLIM